MLLHVIPAEAGIHTRRGTGHAAGGPLDDSPEVL